MSEFTHFVQVGFGGQLSACMKFQVNKYLDSRFRDREEEASKIGWGEAGVDGVEDGESQPRSFLGFSDA